MFLHCGRVFMAVAGYCVWACMDNTQSSRLKPKHRNVRKHANAWQLLQGSLPTRFLGIGTAGCSELVGLGDGSKEVDDVNSSRSFAKCHVP